MEADTLPPAGYRVLDTDDVDRATDEVERLLGRHRLIPLAPDRRVHVVQHYAPLGPVAFGGLSYGGPVEIELCGLEAFYLVEIPLRGGLRVRCRYKQMVATPRRGVIVNPTDVLWKQWQPATAVLTVCLDRGRMLARAEEWAGRPLRGALRFDPAFDSTAGPDQTWCWQVWSVIRDLERGKSGWTADPGLTGRWMDLLMDGILLGHRSSHSTVLHGVEQPAPPRRLRRLLEQIEADPGLPWSTPAMARAAGVGVRAIQKAFARHLDVAPQEFLRQVRLARVRTELLAADPAATTVRQIATRWGFTELGRFAGAYRQRYGEKPSDTLHRE